MLQERIFDQHWGGLDSLICLVLLADPCSIGDEVRRCFTTT